MDQQLSSEPQIGDRITLIDDAPNSIYEVLKISGGHATCRCLSHDPGTGKAGNNRRVPFWKIRHLCATTHVSVGDRVKLHDDPYSLYEVIKIRGDQAKLMCLAYTPGPTRDGRDRTVSLSQIRFVAAADSPPEHSLPLNSPVAAADSFPKPKCNHESLHFGLDAAYCPSCRESFAPHSKEYKSVIALPPEQSLPQKCSGVRHTSSGWIEKYMVRRRWEHHRYCWSDRGGKVIRVHIPRDSGKLLAVRKAIEAGHKPEEIVRLLKAIAKT